MRTFLSGHPSLVLPLTVALSASLVFGCGGSDDGINNDPGPDDIRGDGGSGGNAGTGGSSGDSGVDPEQTRLFREQVDAFVAERIEPDEAGIALSVIGPDGVIFEKAFGMANIAESLPMTLETPTQLASVSKQFTAMAALILHESGELDLNDPISVAFPEAPTAWDAVTFHHLLTHQSGMPFGVNIGNTNDQLLAWAVEQPLAFPAGTGFLYSNTGYVLLAIAIERLSGRPFETFMAEEIFDPLGMEDSSVAPLPGLGVPDRAASYLNGSSLFEVTSSTTGTVGQWSSIEDLKKWDAELRARTLLSEESYDLLFTRHAELMGNCDYGYGWYICDAEGYPTLNEHVGEMLGYRTGIFRLPDERLTVVMVSNGTYDWAFGLVGQLVDLYLSGEPR